MVTSPQNVNKATHNANLFSDPSDSLGPAVTRRAITTRRSSDAGPLGLRKRKANRDRDHSASALQINCYIKHQFTPRFSTDVFHGALLCVTRIFIYIRRLSLVPVGIILAGRRGYGRFFWCVEGGRRTINSIFEDDYGAVGRNANKTAKDSDGWRMNR